MGSIQEIHLPCHHFLSSIPNYFLISIINSQLYDKKISNNLNFFTIMHCLLQIQYYNDREEVPEKRCYCIKVFPHPTNLNHDKLSFSHITVQAKEVSKLLCMLNARLFIIPQLNGGGIQTMDVFIGNTKRCQLSYKTLGNTRYIY